MIVVNIWFHQVEPHVGSTAHENPGAILRHTAMQIILISISKWAQFLKIFFTILEVSLKRNSKAQFVASTFIEKIMKICPNPSLKNSFTYQNIEASLTGRFLLPNYQGRVKRFNQSMVRD